MALSSDTYQTVLIFHGLGSPARQLEPGEARFWLSRDRFCAILDRIAAMGPAAPLITFDDGNASDIGIALPELEARGLTAVFFLLAGRLDQPGSLRREEVTALAAAGQRIGLHGRDHRDWRQLDATGRQQEFRDARAELADLSGQAIDWAAAPFGLYDRRVAGRIATEGFGALFTSDWGQARQDGFLRPRNCIDAEMSEARLTEALNGHVALRRRPRRLIGLARKRLLPAGGAA
ncbi:polysaccharide deacetylase family protein [Pseudodonghicola flavimaris]|uniref:Chitooligosaccharide deacetylase n=1 Tax=Pseudodonghicola flavimaris TaxID=3050036 RepID=A0ABT7EWR3_9RHOB|nr:polysaccharide deacetylase family protein [Pseudodonghicola flavimaris]MDK3016776.1 polysaccharide deacetylase family protein [Pseudodonghicola flavimaris]